MALDSVATQIKDMLENNWSLLGDLAVAQMRFEAGWYNADYSENPQVTVSPLISGDLELFHRTVDDINMKYIARNQYAVTIWLKIESGDEGATEEQNVDLIKNEIIRILINQTSSFPPPLGRVLPVNFGRNLSQINQVPRLLRWEIPVQANRIG